MDAIKKVVRSIQKGETIGIRTVSKTKEEIVAELLAHFTGLDANEIINGHIKKDEWLKILKAVAMLSEKKNIDFIAKNAIVFCVDPDGDNEKIISV